MLELGHDRHFGRPRRAARLRMRRRWKKRFRRGLLERRSPMSRILAYMLCRSLEILVAFGVIESVRAFDVYLSN